MYAANDYMYMIVDMILVGRMELAGKAGRRFAGRLGRAASKAQISVKKNFESNALLQLLESSSKDDGFLENLVGSSRRSGQVIVLGSR